MIRIIYKFTFPVTKADPIKFEINLDEKKILFIPAQVHDESDQSLNWTKLNHYQCSNCTLNVEEHQYCPVAKNLNTLVETFKKTHSHKRSKIYVHTNERSYVEEAPIQEGLFSIFGIIMSTSGCPHLDFMRPMARFHLPFSSSEETMFRITSTFLLRKFIEKQTSFDRFNEDILNIKELSDLYKNVGIVNRDFLTRIRTVITGDVNQNAMVVLNCFTKMVETEVRNEFESLYYLFTDDNY